MTVMMTETTTNGFMENSHRDGTDCHVETMVLDRTGVAALLERVDNYSNRNLSQGTVKRYANIMRAGAWFFNGAPIILVEEPDGRTVLVDGQHRLFAVMETNIPQTFLVETFTGDTEFTRHLRETVDQGKKRTLSDIIKMGGVSTDTEMRATVAAVHALMIGEVLIEARESTYNLLSDGEKYATYLANRNLCVWAAEMWQNFKKVNKNITLPYGTLAAAMRCRRLSPTATDIFFGDIVMGQGLYEGDPAYALLHQILIEGRSRKLTNSLRTHIYWYCVSVRAWNAFAQRKGLTVLKPGREVPKILIPRHFVEARDGSA